MFETIGISVVAILSMLGLIVVIAGVMKLGE